MRKQNRIGFIVLSIALLFTVSFPVLATDTASTDAVLYAAGTGSTSYVPIVIDGNYSDWADKPHSKISYPWDSANTYHLGALFRDDTYLYLHIKMSSYSYSQFNGWNYLFTIDGKQEYMNAVTPNNAALVEGNNTLEIRRQNGYQLVSGGAGIVTRHSGQPDEWEIRIPLTAFPGNPQNFSTITFSCSNLGPQELTATGTPTWPYLLAGVALVTAAVGIGVSRKKRKT